MNLIIKSGIILLLSVLFFSGVHGQSASTKKADKLFADFAYVEAIKLYEELARGGELTNYVCKQLAEANRRIGNTKQAEYWYKMVLDLGTEEPIDYYYYAMALRSNKKYEEAEKWIKKFESFDKTDDSRIERELEAIDTNIIMVADSNWVSISKLSINSKQNDFSPAFYNDKIVFSSAREKKGKIDLLYVWDEQPFIDLYICDIGLENQLLNVKPFSETLNSKYHEGPVTFNKTGNMIYFTRNNYKNKKLGKDGKKTTHLKIYTAILVGETWGNIKEFKYNSKEYSTGHPTISKDGQKLFFASDMPGGFGQADIYVCELIDSEWGQPENLGPQINTEGNEMFPYYHTDGKLYFASDGLVGFGGFDIFSARREENGTHTIINLGYPLNSPKDDFGFVFNKELTGGYFSSNRKGGEGNDDIYAFKVEEEQFDNTDENDDNLAVTDNNEAILFDGKQISVGETITLKNIYYDLDKWNIRQDAARDLNKVIRFMIMYPTAVIELSSHTDCRASFRYNMDLSQKRAASAVEYISTIGGIDKNRMVTKGYGETKLVNECADGVDCTEEQHQLNRRTEFTLLKK